MEKIVHQSWKTTELLSKHAPCVDTIKKVFSDYEYKLWTDDDNDELIRVQFPEFYNFYLTLRPIDKADFARFLYIYQYGGIYADVDVVMFRKIDDVLDNKNEAFLCNQADENASLADDLVLDPFFFAGKKGSSFFYTICEAMQRGTIYKLLSPEINDSTPMAPLYKTANILLSKFYVLNQHKYKIKIWDELFANDYTYRDAIDKSRYYGVHHQTHTWMDWLKK